MSWQFLLLGIGLALVIEGLLYTLFPDGMRRALAALMTLESGKLRWIGAGTIGLGVALVALAAP